MRRALVLVAALALLTVAGCSVRGGPITSVGFAGGSQPAKTGIIVTVDIISAPGWTTDIKYPQEYVTVAPFWHYHEAAAGSMAHYSIKVYPTEPGQSVTCSILHNGSVVASGDAEYPAGAICIGPPV